jgi:hypothetical protein
VIGRQAADEAGVLIDTDKRTVATASHGEASLIPLTIARLCQRLATHLTQPAIKPGRSPTPVTARLPAD